MAKGLDPPSGGGHTLKPGISPNRPLAPSPDRTFCGGPGPRGSPSAALKVFPLQRPLHIAAGKIPRATFSQDAFFSGGYGFVPDTAKVRGNWLGRRAGFERTENRQRGRPNEPLLGRLVEARGRPCPEQWFFQPGWPAFWPPCNGFEPGRPPRAKEWIGEKRTRTHSGLKLALCSTIWPAYLHRDRGSQEFRFATRYPWVDEK